MAEDAFAWSQRKYAERAQRVQDLRQAATPAPLIPEAQPTRSFGFQSGAARGAAEGRNADLAVAGAEIGAPTSYDGGVGAPPSVAIMRGTKTTFQNPAADQGEGGGYVQTPGSSPREFATSLQAAQSYNRGTGKGEYVPPKGPEIAATGAQQLLVNAAENKNPKNVAEGKLFDLQLAEQKKTADVNEFTKRWQGQYGKYDTSGAYVKPTDPTIAQDLRMAEEVARTGGHEAGMKHYDVSRQVRQYEPLFTPDNLATFRGTLPPAQQQNPVFSESYLNALKQNPRAWRETVLQLGPRLSQLSKPPQRSLGESLFQTQPASPWNVGP